MNLLSRFKYHAIKSSEVLLKKTWGAEFPDKEQTVNELANFLISPDTESDIMLPEVLNVADKSEVIFSAMMMDASRNMVWDFKPDRQNASQLRIGSVITDNRVLQTDFGYPLLLTDDFGGKYVFKDLITPDLRPVQHVEILIAPWSHYFRKEYYMFLMFIAAKICRIKNVIGEDVFKEAVISYPLFHTSFEREYLDLLGIEPGKIVDSRKKKITFDRCVLGNNDNWGYPNKADIFALKKHVGPLLEAGDTGRSGKRVYICRSGRRRVLNERELIRLLEKWDFEIIEDKPRTVAEQYSIYHNASFIMGPHGSSFTNIVWCKPGAHLFELFGPSYVYRFFLYLAEMLGLSYSAYCNGPVLHDYRSKTINDDIVVSIPEIERYLTASLRSQ